MVNSNDTIAAIATATGGGVGIVRISGKSLHEFACKISKLDKIEPRYALYVDFYDDCGDTIDRGILLYFPAPASFTGEDVVELHGHGGTVVLNLLLQRCIQLGARPAQAGEFSQRAFLNGKMDLVQAESVADLISASGERAARMAMCSLKGKFSEKIHNIKDDLIHLRMLVEATLDFPEEEIDFINHKDIISHIDSLQLTINDVLATAKQGAILRDGINIVLIGAPNVGKSSLLNALAGDEVAIVTDIAGTTRDTVRENISLQGVPVHIIDTAGLRSTDDVVEQKGIERSRNAVQTADIVLILTEKSEKINAETQALLSDIPAELKQIEVVNKIDLIDMPPDCKQIDGRDVVYISAKKNMGLDLLEQVILRHIGWHNNEEGLFLARTRHVFALQQAYQALSDAKSIYQPDLLSEHLRQAQNELGKITGEFSADDLLGEIFSNFCIGK
ncbi:MAG: tRNA uridine-5-carboxymethylaminomethyl(34) synthesis GTPase MnmE [Neisseriaceae bacterium]|nr:tRNA uridine-5-carboxymethylaminomethyl(34) synthesis GTPase MnmE [Neisseriaceae bacterium]